jgi:hypothetical protein
MSYGWISYNASFGLLDLDLPPAALCKIQLLVLLAFEELYFTRPRSGCKTQADLAADSHLLLLREKEDAPLLGYSCARVHDHTTPAAVATALADGEAMAMGQGPQPRPPRSQAPNPDGNAV